MKPEELRDLLEKTIECLKPFIQEEIQRAVDEQVRVKVRAYLADMQGEEIRKLIRDKIQGYGYLDVRFREY